VVTSEQSTALNEAIFDSLSVDPVPASLAAAIEAVIWSPRDGEVGDLDAVRKFAPTMAAFGVPIDDLNQAMDTLSDIRVKAHVLADLQNNIYQQSSPAQRRHRARVRTINDFFQQLFPSWWAANMINRFTRRKMKKDGFFSRIMPSVMFDGQIDDNSPIQVLD